MIGDHIGMTALHAAVQVCWDWFELGVIRRAQPRAQCVSWKSSGDWVSCVRHFSTVEPFVLKVRGHPATVEILLAEKANVDARTGRGTTPLMFCAVGGHRECAELLLQSGADVNATGNLLDLHSHIIAFL